MIMKKFITALLFLGAIFPVCAQNHTRMIVTTDIGGSDPDDIQG